MSDNIYTSSPIGEQRVTVGALSNGSMDELKKRAFVDDYCESDDDLRREDILFPTDSMNIGE